MMKGTTTLRVFAATCLLTISMTGAASAAPLGPDCGSCFGTIWDLTATPVDAAAHKYFIDFTATGTAASAALYDFIDAIAFKIVPSAAHIESVSLVSSPGGSWDLSSGPLGGPTGCSGNAAPSGWLCLAALDPGVAAPGDGATLLWRFLVDLDGALLDGQAASIQATMTQLFAGGGGPFVDQQTFAGELSESLNLTITQVPEPGLLALMGVGMLAAARRQFRRRNQA